MGYQLRFSEKAREYVAGLPAAEGDRVLVALREICAAAESIAPDHSFGARGPEKLFFYLGEHCFLYELDPLESALTVTAAYERRRSPAA